MIMDSSTKRQGKFKCTENWKQWRKLLLFLIKYKYSYDNPGNSVKLLTSSWQKYKLLRKTFCYHTALRQMQENGIHCEWSAKYWSFENIIFIPPLTFSWCRSAHYSCFQRDSESTYPYSLFAGLQWKKNIVGWVWELQNWLCPDKVSLEAQESCICLCRIHFQNMPGRRSY